MNMLVKSLAAVTTVSAGALAAPAIPTTTRASINIGGTEPLPIEKLWAEREKIVREYKQACSARDRLEATLLRRMPKPHPSITFGPENDVDGLKYSGGGEVTTMHGYIHPPVIKSGLAVLQPNRWEKTTIDGCLALVERKEPLPLSTEELALRDRLTARLDLSLRYERKIKRTEREIGLAGVQKRIAQLCKQQIQIDKRIMAQRATTRPAFAIKLAIWRDYGEDYEEAEAIVRDVQFLVDLPGAFGDAWAFDPNEEIDKARARKSMA